MSDMERIAEKLDEIILNQQETHVEVKLVRKDVDNMRSRYDEKCSDLNQKIDKTNSKVWQIMFWAVTTLLLGGAAVITGCATF